MVASPSGERRRAVVILVIVQVLCLVPFVTKAFHIDDTLFLWTARHIHANPFNFYGYSANWIGYEMPMHLINQNPPLVSYLIALAAFLFRWSEVALHTVFILPAVSVGLGTYFLALRLTSRPLPAALITVFTPAFLVSGTSLMSDTTMAAFYVWATVFWLKGLSEDRPVCLLAGGVLISLSALTKYFGMSLVPLLAVFTLAEKRRPGSWILYLLLPVLILAGYEWATWKLYGHGLLSGAFSFSAKVLSTKSIPMDVKILSGLAFFGGCLASAFFFAPLIWPRRVWIAAGSVLLPVCFTVLVTLESRGTLFEGGSGTLRWGFIIQYAVFILAGIHILALALSDLRERRNAGSLLLFLWVAGTFFFAVFLNWTVNARVVLPAAPAVGILVMRRYGRREETRGSRPVWHWVLPLFPAVVVTLAVAGADASLANCQRSAAESIREDYEGYPHTIWFQGHWGFQYYMESIGAKPLELRKFELAEGDIIVIPSNNCYLWRLPYGVFHLSGKKSRAPMRWIGIMSSEAGAGFYNSECGPLPYVIGTVMPEEYSFYLYSETLPEEALRRFGGRLR